MRRAVLILLILLCCSCEKEPANYLDLPVCQSIILEHEMFNHAMQSSDPFDIISGEIIDDCLKIYVSYGGGCEEHDFSLYYEALPQLSQYSGSLLLSHNANGDLCEALISESLYFDLTDVQDTAKNMVRLALQLNTTDSDDYLLIDYYYQ